MVFFLFDPVQMLLILILTLPIMQLMASLLLLLLLLLMLLLLLLLTVILILLMSEDFQEWINYWGFSKELFHNLGFCILLNPDNKEKEEEKEM